MVLKVVLLSIVLMAIAFAGFAISILMKKNGRFPEIHIGRSKEMKKRGISCATSQDKIERAKVKVEQLKLNDKGSRIE